MRNLSDRLAKLEARLLTQTANADQAADAQHFVDNITRLAERYPPEAATTPQDEQEQHFSPAQRLAWAFRFATPQGFAQALDDAAAMLPKRETANG